MTTTIEFITALFCQVDDHLAGLPKHPEAHLWREQGDAGGNCKTPVEWPARFQPKEHAVLVLG